MLCNACPNSPQDLQLTTLADGTKVCLACEEKMEAAYRSHGWTEKLAIENPGRFVVATRALVKHLIDGKLSNHHGGHGHGQN